MQNVTSKDRDFSSDFDKMTDDDINNTIKKELLFDNVSVQTIKGKLFGQVPLEHIFGFCNMFKKVTRVLVFHITFKTHDLQSIFCITLPETSIFNITFDN